MIERFVMILVAITAFTPMAAQSAERVPPGFYPFGQVVVLNPPYDTKNRCTGLGDGKPSAPSTLSADERGNLTISLGNINQTRSHPSEDFDVSIALTAKMIFNKATAGDIDFLAPAYLVRRDHWRTLGKDFVPAKGSFAQFSSKVTRDRIVLSFKLSTRVETRLPCKFDIEATFFR